MSEADHHSDPEFDDPNKITDATACLNYLKRREVFLYKMMNDPSHKAMLYFLEVLMNSSTPVTINQLADRFSHKSFSSEMREACGGGSAEGLRDFLLKYASLFDVHDDGTVTSVAIDLPEIENLMSEQVTDNTSQASSQRSLLNWERNANNVIRANRNRNQNSTSSDTKTDDALFRNHSNGNNKQRHVNDIQAYKSNTKDTCASTLSLVSEQSLSSTNSSFASHQNDEQDGSCAHINEKEAFDDGPCRRRSCLATPPSSRPSSKVGCECCAIASLAHASFRHVDDASSTCLTCPILDLTTGCNHHLHHHRHQHCTSQAGSYCHCNTASMHCCSCSRHQHHSCGHSLLSNTGNASCRSNGTRPFCTIEPMEKLLIETEAVKIFQQRLLKREEKWIPIKSLAGHLSQTSSEIRAVVGPQLEFRNFLLRHPQVFEVQGDLVSVIDPLGDILNQRKYKDRHAFNALPLHTSRSSNNLLMRSNRNSNYNDLNNSNISSSAVPINYRAKERSPRPKSLILNSSTTVNSAPWLLPSLFNNNNSSSLIPPNRKSFIPKRTSLVMPTGPLGPTTNNFGQSTNLNSLSSSLATAPSRTSSAFDRSGRDAASSSYSSPNSLTMTMTTNEYQAIMLLRKVLDKNDGKPGQVGMPLLGLLQFVKGKAATAIQSTIGSIPGELEDFLVKHPVFFHVTGQVPANKFVNNKRLQQIINIVICGTKSSDEDAPSALTRQCGRVFHVAKLWGIIDLGKHEHVFFDKSIFKHVDDLQKYFKVDELLYFNAVLASKESRAKWRATHVWKDCDLQQDQLTTSILSQSSSIDSRQPSRLLDVATEAPGRLEHTLSSGTTIPSTSSKNDRPSVKFKSNSVDNEALDTVDDDLDANFDNLTTGDDKNRRVKSLLGCGGPSYTGLSLDEEEETIEGDEQMFTSYMEDSNNGYKAESSSVVVDDDYSTERHNTLELAKSNGKMNREGETTVGMITTSNNQYNSVDIDLLSNSKSNFNCNGNNNDDATSESSSGSAGISIAVQTMSTGDIMATQFYHDRTKLAVDRP